MIWSTPLATSSIPTSSDIDLIVLSLFVPPHYLSVQRDVVHPTLLACFHCWFYFPFSTDGLSSLSVEDQWVCSMEPLVSNEFTYMYIPLQYHAHLIRTPSLSVISLLSLLSMTAALCYLVLVRSLYIVCRRTLGCFLISFLSSWHHIAPLSNSVWLISSSS